MARPQRRSRVRQLHRNAGTFGVLRLLVVGLLFVGIGVMIGIQLGDPTPLICLLVGASIPVLLRRRMIADVERTARVGRSFGLALVGTSVVIGLAKERVMAVVSEALLIDALALAVGLYLSFFVVLYSDPDVVRADR